MTTWRATVACHARASGFTSAAHFVGAHKVTRRLERLFQTSSTVIYTLWFGSLSSSNVGRAKYAIGAPRLRVWHATDSVTVNDRA